MPIELTPQQRLESGELFYRAAERYRAAAQRVAEPYLDEENSILRVDDWVAMYDPIAQLYGQSFELYLKAHLLGQDFTIDQLRGFTLGHKLDQLLQSAMANTLIIEDQHKRRMLALNSYYATHRFRYPTTDPMTVALPSDLNATCDALRQAAYPSVHQKAKRIGKVTPA